MELGSVLTIIEICRLRIRDGALDQRDLYIVEGLAFDADALAEAGFHVLYSFVLLRVSIEHLAI